MRELISFARVQVFCSLVVRNLHRLVQRFSIPVATRVERGVVIAKLPSFFDFINIKIYFINMSDVPKLKKQVIRISMDHR